MTYGELEKFSETCNEICVECKWWMHCEKNERLMEEELERYAKEKLGDK